MVRAAPLADAIAFHAAVQFRLSMICACPGVRLIDPAPLIAATPCTGPVNEPGTEVVAPAAAGAVPCAIMFCDEGHTAIVADELLLKKIRPLRLELGPIANWFAVPTVTAQPFGETVVVDMRYALSRPNPR